MLVICLFGISLFQCKPSVIVHAPTVENITVYHEPGRFGGWPANFGIWNWEDEILVGFATGYHKDLGEERHNIDREKPQYEMLARSHDGGVSWTIEDPSKDGVLVPRGAALHGTEPDPENLPPITSLDVPIDFSKPGIVLKFWMLDVHVGPSIFYYSYDKGHTWNGPYNLVVDGMQKIAARIDYMIEDENSCLAFLTAAKENDREGRVFVARTDDGGLTWQFVSWVGEEPETGFRIMPSTVRTSDSTLILTSRVREEISTNELTSRENENSRYIDAWVSNDQGKSWTFSGKPVADLGEGNPPCLIKLRDGRLCLTYGFRAKPYSIRAKISADDGATWGEEIMLRNDGSGRDVGYVRSVQRRDGKVVTIYYFQDEQKPERYIGCTIWDPDTIDKDQHDQ